MGQWTESASNRKGFDEQSIEAIRISWHYKEVIVFPLYVRVSIVNQPRCFVKFHSLERLKSGNLLIITKDVEMS